VIIRTPRDLEGLKKIGRIVALTIQEMKRNVRVGMTTKELDDIGLSVLQKHGANSAPQVTYNFPGATCISVNDEVAHGIPGDRVIQGGDLVNIDVSAELDGYFADAGHSFQVEPHDPKLVKLCNDTHATMMKVIERLKHGTKLNEVGRTIEAEAKKSGYNIIENLCSHGIGLGLHEEPYEILPVYDPSEKFVLKEGQVLTIEPFLSLGASYVVEQQDGWTLKTPDSSFVAQHEHTIVITRGRPIILTLPE
jgi:methionyl aminopeptidase